MPIQITLNGAQNDTEYIARVMAVNEKNQPNTSLEGSVVQATPKAHPPLSDLPEGVVVMLPEGGAPVPFYLAKHSYEAALNGPGRELLVRKDCYDSRAWNSSSRNGWSSCSLRSWLNGEYLSLLDAGIRGRIKTTEYYFTVGNGDSSISTRSDAVFMLSLTELGSRGSYANKEGSALPIASTLVIGFLNGTARHQWSRTPYRDEANGVYLVTDKGVSGISSTNNSHYSRPCFTLPADAMVEQEPNPDGSYNLILT